MKASNDNSPTWIGIGLHAALIVNKLRCRAQLTEMDKEQNEQRERDPAPGRSDEQKRAEQRRYVEKRLRELAAFERKVSGK